MKLYSYLNLQKYIKIYKVCIYSCLDGYPVTISSDSDTDSSELEKQALGWTKIAYLDVYRILLKTVIVTLGSNYLQLLFNNKQSEVHATLNPVSLWAAGSSLSMQWPPMSIRPATSLHQVWQTYGHSDQNAEPEKI